MSSTISTKNIAQIVGLALVGVCVQIAIIVMAFSWVSGNQGALRDSAYSEGFRDGRQADRAIALIFGKPSVLVASSGAVKRGEVRSACPGYTRIEPAWTVGASAPAGLMLVLCPRGVEPRGARGRADG